MTFKAVANFLISPAMKNHPWLRSLAVFAAACLLTAGAAEATPLILVEQPAGTNIADGGTKNFGTVVTQGTNTLTFTIRNSGDADLTGLAVTKDVGPTANDFTFTPPLTTTVVANGTTTFTVQFAP